MNFQPVDILDRITDRWSPVSIIDLEFSTEEYLDDLSDYDDGEYLITAEEWKNAN